jgi:hypothetical protein
MIRNGIWILLVWGLVVAAACSQMRKPDAQTRARKRPILAYPGPTRLPADYLDNLRKSSEYQHGGVAAPAKPAKRTIAKTKTGSKKVAKKSVSKKSISKKAKKYTRKVRPARKTASLRRTTSVGSPSGLVKE